ncbi:MAG: LuxR C-terminal-related transcriptional regulator, partial [Actinomycetota bacterium]
RPVVEALRPLLLPDRAPEDPALEPFRGVLRNFAIESRSPGPRANELLLFEAVGRLLAAEGRDQGVALVLEDLHWADADTLGLMEYLADAVQNERVACLCTLRDEPGPALDLAEALGARRVATVLRLARLSAAGVEEMTASALALASVPRDLLDALDVRAQGVPFVVEEMLTTYVASGGDVRAPASLPHTFRELVRARLARVDDQTRTIVFSAAVIGRTFDWSLLVDLSGRSREQVLAALHEAVREQLVVADPSGGFEMPFGFRHALLREALIAELLPPELAELSSRAADAIEARYPGVPGEWCERVAELREAEGDPTAAARHLQEAANRAVARGALASAIDMLEHARSLTTRDRWHTIGIDRALIDVLSLAGRTDRLREIGRVASSFIDEKRRLLPGITLARGDIHLRLARAMAAVGDDAAVDEHLTQARDYLKQTGEKRVRAELALFESQRALARGDLVRAREGAAEVLAMAAEAGLGEIIGEAMSVDGHAALLFGDAQGALDVFGRARQEARRPLGVVRAVLDLGTVQALLEGSIDTLHEAHRLAVEAGALEYATRAQLAIAQTLIDRFDLETAAEELAACLDTARRYRLAVLPKVLAVEARRLALAGDTSGAVRMLAEARPTSADACLTRAVIAVLEEELDEAREALRPAPFGTAAALSGLLEAARGDALEGTAVAGNVAEGLAAHARAIAERDADAFEVADATLVANPWWRHVARRIVAGAALDGEWGEPAVWLQGALAFFEHAGHDRNIQACRALLRRAGAPVPRKGRGDSTVPEALRGRGVTSREMDVLRLLVQGLGNREIAARLFISHRTVETHVASLMRKLDAGSRDQLVAEASD